MEPDADIRSHLVRVLGPGVTSMAATTDLPPVVGDDGGKQGGVGVTPVVVVTGPSVPLSAAAAALSTVRALVPSPRWWPVAVVAVAHRCSNAALRDALEVGLSDLIGIDATPDQLRHAVRRAGLELAGRRMVPIPGATTSETRVTAGGGPIAVFAPKGGAGASTVAVNVAVGLAARRLAGPDDQWAYPAVIIDADLQFGDQALMLGLDPVCSLASVTAGHPADPHRGSAPQGGSTYPGAEVFEDLLLTHRRSGVALLGAPVDPALADTVPVAMVTAVMETIGTMSAWVVVDLPSAIGDLTLEVIDRSSHLLVVTGTDPTSVKDARITADTLDRLGLGSSRWTLVCNAVDAPGGLGVAQIEQHVGVAARALIPWDSSIPESLLRGNPAVLEFPGCGASAGLMGLVDLLVGADRPTPVVSAEVGRYGHLDHVRRRVLAAARSVVAQSRE